MALQPGIVPAVNRCDSWTSLPANQKYTVDGERGRGMGGSTLKEKNRQKLKIQ